MKMGLAINIEYWPKRLYKFAVLLLFIIVFVFCYIEYNSKIILKLQNDKNVSENHNLKPQSQETTRNFQMYQVCHCHRAEHRLLMDLNKKESHLESSCSDHATARGPGQKVVSYSFYGTVSNKYFNGITHNLEAVKKLYPGWVLRLYHNIRMDDPKGSKVLCKHWCENDHFDVCDVQHLPSKLGNQSSTFGTLWRFFVLGDPLVDIFLVRDLDSMIIQREVDAVHHWLNNKYGPTWHIMRDNIMHGVSILGGMWGGMNRNLKLTTLMRQRFIAEGKQWRKGYDQDLLNKIVWPWVLHDMVSHDSYLCTHYNGTEPWPTKRIGNQFVGDSFPWPPHKGKPRECPKQCRPIKHPNWIYC